MRKLNSNKCKYCGLEIERQTVSGFCSYGCYEKYVKLHKTPNCVCPICGNSFYVKPFKIANTKHLICCSKECGRKYRSKWFSGSSNHQYGLKGENNPTFAGEEIIRKNHRNNDIRIYAPYRPDADNIGRVIKHKLIVEENYQTFGEQYFDVVEGYGILKKEFVVHHKDGNHNNNDISNLEILTRGEHTSIHNKLRKQKNKIMTEIKYLNEYQQRALETAIYPQDKKIIYPTLGLTGEAGEVADKVKKVLRDNNQVFDDEKRKAIALELSDVMWYCATLANDLGYTLQEIAEMNYEKLLSRQKRGKINGSGDYR